MRFLLLITALILFGYSQIDAQQKIEELLSSESKILRVDEFENIYVISENNKLSKYSRRIELLYEYSFNQLGTVTDLDVSNPQKILLFFSDYQIILYLDNTLSEIDRLNLDELGYWNISCVGLSPDNRIWLYDTQNNKLVKIDHKGKELYSSNEFYMEQFTKEPNLDILSDQEHTLLCSSSQCLVFDSFGHYQKTLSVPNDKISLKQGKIFVLEDNQIRIETFKPSFEETPVFNIEEESNITDFDLYRNGTLYYLTNEAMKKFRIN
jgi:YHS domain-containing protein